jgi:uncharacterized protein (DUF697 family)
MSQKKPNEEAVDALVKRYSLIATGEMIAIPIPGVDVAAVFLTWAKMIQDIGRAYGKELSLSDAKSLAWSFLRHGLAAGGAWFGSAAVAQLFLKAIPLTGHVAAYLVDATIAAASISKITRAMAKSAQDHFEVVTDEPGKKKNRLWDDVLTQIVSAGTALAAIIRGLKPR